MKQWKPGESVSFWINFASRTVSRAQETRLRPLGFGMSQMPVLHALQEGASLSQKELALRAKVEQPTMALMLGRMERDGLVERAPNPDDGRGSLVSLTRKARARIPEGQSALLANEKQATSGFTAEEKKVLVELLQRVRRNLDPEQQPLGVSCVDVPARRSSAVRGAVRLQPR